MEDLFGPVPVPKRRRTDLRVVPNRAWALEQEESSALLDDEAEVAAALGILASAASFAEAKAEVEDGGSEYDEGSHDSELDRKRERKLLHRGKPHSGIARTEPSSYRAGPSGDTVLAHKADGLDPESGGPGFRLSQFASVPAGAFPGNGATFPTRSSVQHPGLIGKQDGSHPPRDSLGAAEARPIPPFKRCASHVYIARFIEYQANKNRLQQAQQWQSNGFGSQHLPEAELPERPLGTNGNFSRLPTHTVPEPASILPASQELPAVSGAHPFLGPPGFPAGAGPASGMQGLPPAYAQLFNQQQGGFPFGPPGQQMGTGMSNQQQAALAQALANCSRFFTPYSMQMMNGGIAQHIAALAGLPVPPNGAPSPSLPMQMPKGQLDAPGKLPNGTALKQEDGVAALSKVGLPPAALAGVDLDRLRTMLPPGFFEQRSAALGQPQLVDGLKPLPGRGEQPPLDSWGPGLPTRM